MPGKNHFYYHANDHRLERAFSAPTPSGESFSTMTTDTAIRMSNITNRDQNGGSNALLLGHQTPRNDRKRGLGNDYVSDATLLTTTSTVGIINETKVLGVFCHSSRIRRVNENGGWQKANRAGPRKNECKQKSSNSNHTRKAEESRAHSAQKQHRKRGRPATPPVIDEPSACRLTFMVIGALVIVFAIIFGTIYLIIYRMKLLEKQ